MSSTIRINAEVEKWYLAYTKPKSEKKAKYHLENQGFETYLPLLSIGEKDKQISSNLEPLFSRYIFFKFNKYQDSFVAINSTRGISNIVIFGDYLAEVPYEIIEYLKKNSDRDGIILEKTITNSYSKGEKFNIKSGSFKGIEAIYLSRKSKDRVRVLLKLINKAVTADIPISDIGIRKKIEKFKL